MLTKKKSLLIIFLLVSFSANIFSQQQEIYKTIKGDIAFTILFKDITVVAASNQLIAVLNYDTGKLIFRVQYSTFHTGIDSIDNELKLLNVQELKFDGTLDIFINPKRKTAQKYNMTGMMTSTSAPISAEGNGTVLCVPAIGSDVLPSCKLYATIKCKLSELSLTGIFKNAYNDTEINIRQSLLERDKQN